MHRLKDVLVLYLDAHAHLIPQHLYGLADTFQITIGITHIHEHRHDKVTLHDTLADILDIDVALVHQPGNPGHDAFPILANDGNEEQFLSHSHLIPGPRGQTIATASPVSGEPASAL
jgi:hypothetical protein